MTAIIDALLGLKVRLQGSNGGIVTDKDLESLGFGTDDFTKSDGSIDDEKYNSIVKNSYTISHAKIYNDNLYIGISEWSDEGAKHLSQRFLLLQN